MTEQEKEQLDNKELEITSQTLQAYFLCIETRKKCGFIKCPRCMNTLNFIKNMQNGHLWGRCETEGCLSWLE